MEVVGFIGVLLCLVFVICVASAVYYYFKSKFSVWRSQGVRGPRAYPFFGTSLPLLLKGIVQADLDTVRTHGKIVGIYEGGHPGLLVTDDAFMREVLFTDFNNFVNRRTFADWDGVYSKMLNLTQDDDWRRIRRLLTPMFSTGKLKQMVSVITACADHLVNKIGNQYEADMDVELLEFCSAFAMDVIGSATFGIEVDSQRYRNNEFVKYGKKLANLSMGNSFGNIPFLFRRLGRYLSKLGVSARDKDALRFFASIVHKWFNAREKENEASRNFIELMRDAHKEGFHNNEEGLTKLEVLAQSLMFFVAGYENTAGLLALLLYNLACNPACQDKLYAELQEALNEKEELTYDHVQKLGYLDMCLQETLRRYPPVSRIERIASSDVTVQGVNLPKGSFVAIPIHAIHMNPEIWPEPTKFIPERFLPELHTQRNPLHHLPFGYGPRSCIAMRLAMLEVKIAAVQVIRNFRLVATARTEIPLKFQRFGFTKTRNGIWVTAWRH